MPLDPQAQQVIDQIERSGIKPIEELSPEEARRQPTPDLAVMAVLKEQGRERAAEAVARVEDRMIPGPAGEIAVRVYWPVGEPPLPLLAYWHGGGWVIADLDVYDASPRALANATRCIVVSAHYRQGPEHPFPAAHDDAVTAYRWVLENATRLGGDPARVAVAGESAGGNLAAAVSLAARDEGLPMPVHQLLVYPVTDHSFDTASYREHAHAKPLNAAMMRWFFDHYVPDESQRDDPRLSLVHAELVGLPPATIITAEADPLRDDGRLYAVMLRDAGVDVVAYHYEGAMHEFFGMGAVIDEAKHAVEAAATRLRDAFGLRPLAKPELAEGMEVHSLDEQAVGQVKELRNGDFLLDRSGLKRDVFVPVGAVARIYDGRVELGLREDELDAMDLPNPSLL